VRSTVVFCFHRSLASRQGRFALRYAGLTPLHFALGNVVRGLGQARGANEQEAITEDNEGDKEALPRRRAKQHARCVRYRERNLR
jgi:hypothetical protein